MAGLATGWSLSRAGRPAVLFEKSRGVSGRAATRRREQVRYDHGANFFRTEDPEINRLVHEALPTADLVEIPGEVWTFDSEGVVSPGDKIQNAVPKYSYRDGIRTLGKLLLSDAGADLQTGSRIERIHQEESGWFLFDTRDQPLGPYTEVVLTPPAPQTAELLAASRMNPLLQEGLVKGLQSVSYQPQFSFILGFEEQCSRPGPLHALVNSDGNHVVSWVSFEEDKAGHVTSGQSVIVVQMSPAWTKDHYGEDPEVLLLEVCRQLKTLLPGVGAKVDWWDCQRWRYAHPESAIDLKTARMGESAGLHICGDALAGRGRVALALKTGLDCARRIIGTGKDAEQRGGTPHPENSDCA